MLYFICGSDARELKYFELLEKIKTENPGIQEYVFDVMLKEEEQFLEKLNFNSLFGGKEILVLKRAEKLESVEEMTNIISKVILDSKYVILDYYYDSSKKNDKLFTHLKEVGNNTSLEIIKVEENEKNIPGYIEKNLEISNKEALKLIQLIGENSFKVKNEVEKIQSFLNGEKYDFEKIKEIITIEKEYFIYECVEKAINGDIFVVMDYLKKTKEYMGFLYSIYNEVDTLLKLSALEEDGHRLGGDYNSFKNEYEKVKKYFYVNKRPAHPYAIFNKYKNLKKFNKKKLKMLNYRCWELEKDIKLGKIPMDIGVETLIMEINNR